MATVRVDNLSFAYPGASEAALRNINLSLTPGEVVLLTGPSGCGKSTLALALAGLIPARVSGAIRGSVYLDDANMRQMAIHDIAQRVGIVFQNPDNQIIQLSVEEEVAFGLENLRLPTDEIERRLVDALSVTGMLGMRREPVFALSGGQKQRVVIAAALAMRPSVLVLDEPTSDLDPIGTQEVLRVLYDLKRERAMTIVLIEHKVDEVIAWVDRVLLMDRGQIIIDAPTTMAFADLQRWRNLGVSVPQFIQVARSLPEVFFGATPLTLDDMLASLASTPYAHALQTQAANEINEANDTSEASAAPPFLDWRHVELAYGDHRVLRDISMELRHGEWLALIGANGSGKTSLASLAMGFQKPTSGEVEAEGRVVRSGDISRQARATAYLFQAADSMLFADTVEHELRFGLKRPQGKKDTHERELEINQVLEVTRLTAYRATNPFHLSHGQRKRLAIGSLLTRQPRALILDEPTTGQDESHARAFLEFLEELRVSRELTYLMITHDMRAVATYATRVIALRDGAVALDGPPGAVFAQGEALASCGIVPPPVARLHARLCNDQAQTVALSASEFIKRVTGGVAV
jgi:energy-coupling factor transport system ATP-binding protein